MISVGSIGIAGDLDELFFLKLLDIVVHHGTAKMGDPRDCVLAYSGRIVDGQKYR